MLNIHGIEGENLGGISRLFFTEQKNLIAQPAPDRLLIQGNLTLAAGAVWNYFIPTPYTTSYEEQEERTPHGFLYSQELKGFRAKDSLDLARAWDELRGKKLILLYVDANNTCRLVGDTEDYVLLSRKLDTAAAPSNRNGYNFSFQGSSTHPAYFFNGSFTVSEIGPTLPATGGTGGPVTIKDVYGNILGIAPSGSTWTLPDIFLTIDDSKYLT